MQPEIRRADSSKEFLTHENCFILEVANWDPRITNVGDEDLLFLCICTPRFVQNAYVSEP
jgi:hypothetical protein